MAKSSAHPHHEGVRAFLVMALASVSALALSAPASAQPLDQASRTASAERDFDIPAQPLSTALLRLAEQARLQILFSQADIAGLTSRPVHGHLTPAAALAQLLPLGAPRIEIAGDRVVRTDLARPQPVQNEPDTEIVVTGTRIRGAAPVGSDLTIIDRDPITDSRYATTQQVLQSLPQNFGGAPSEANTLNGDAGQNFAFGSGVDLRGLGADATLTLVNGRRIAPGGFGNFTDVSNIPLVAVERAEVLSDGASSVYGSDAVAGVVNLILRPPSDTVETALSYGSAEGGADETVVSQRFGAAWDGGGGNVALEYRDRGRLGANERPYAASTDLRPFGGGDFRTSFANPGNIVQIGADLVQYAIPEGQDGTTLTAAQLASGVVNLQNARARTDLLPDQTNRAIYVSAEQKLTHWLRFSAEALWGQRQYRALDDDAGTFTLTVPETNAYRQANGLFAGQGDLRIQYSFLDDLGPIVREGVARQAFISMGLDADLPGEWQMDVYGAYADERDHGTFCCQPSFALLNAVLASSDLNSAFNPFADGSNTDPTVLASITRRDLTRQHSHVTTFAAKADRPLFALPAGPVRAAFGGEWHDESFDLSQIRETGLGVRTDLTSSRPGARTVSAVFGELLVPLLEGTGERPALELSLSARFEDYSDFGDTTNPKLGLRWTPIEGLDLRGSYSTSFRAPQLVQLGTPSQGFVSEDPASFDAFATGTGTNLLFLGGGSPDLEPETSENWSAGFDLSPTGLPDLRLSLTYFSIAFENRIATPPNYIDAYTHPERFQGVFVRNPTQDQVDFYIDQIDSFFGPLPAPGEVEAIFDNRLQNIARMDVSGVDLHASYHWDTGWGAFDLDGALSWLEQFQTNAGGLDPTIDRLDTVGGQADLKSRLNLAWSNGPWRMAAAWNYVDGYDNEASILRPEVEAWSTIDLRLAYELGGEHGATLAVSALNVFDEDPPFVDGPSSFGCMLHQQSAGSGDLIGPELRSTPRDFGDSEFLEALTSARAFPESFAECLALEPERLLACLAILVAETVDLTHEGASARDAERQRSGDLIAAAIDLDMSAHWSAGADFWVRTAKQYALAALSTAPALAALDKSERSAKLKAMAKLKKTAFAEAMAKAFAESRWLPDCLITPLRAGALALAADAAEAIAPAQH